LKSEHISTRFVFCPLEINHSFALDRQFLFCFRALSPYNDQLWEISFREVS